MAEMAEGGGGGHGKGKKRAKKSSTRVDMTPMVDLAFLLLTFFVLTSTFSKPKMLPLAYPSKVDDKTDVKGPKMNNGITFLLSEDKIFYYQGEYYFKGHMAPDGSVTELKEADFGPGEKGVRKLLGKLNNYVLVKKQGLDEKLKRKEINDSIYLKKLDGLRVESEALKVLIKTDDKALCKNFIDLVDELKIAEIGVIAPVDITPGELQLMKEKLKK
jgi:biopolymer transport protein ExbD